jgi:hypothetical protein
MKADRIHTIGGIPYFFKRCALTRDLFDLVVEVRPSMTSAGLAEHVKRMWCTEKKSGNLQRCRASLTRIQSSTAGVH